MPTTEQPYQKFLPVNPKFPWPSLFSPPTEVEAKREEREAKRRVREAKRRGWLA